MKKLRLFSLSVVIVVLMTTGCDTGVNSEKDAWSDVTSLSQINGTWKGSFSETMSYKEWFEEDGGDWTSEMEAAVGDMKVTITIETVMTINAGAQTFAMSIKTSMRYSGSKIAGMWEDLREAFEEIADEAEEELQVSFVDKTHTVIMSMDSPAAPVPDDFMQDLQINQNGRKLRDSEEPELVFIKQ